MLHFLLEQFISEHMSQTKYFVDKFPQYGL